MYVRHVLAYDQDMKPLGYPLTNNTTNSVVLTKDKLLGASYIIVAMRTADSSNLKVSTLDGAFISVKSPITDRLQMLESNVQYKLTPVTNANASLFNLSDSLTFEKGYRYLLDINSKSGWQFSLVNCAGGITYASANGTPTNWFGKLLLEVDSSISAGLMFQKLDASKSPIVLDSSMLADVGFTITKYKAKNWNTNAVIIAAANSSESDKNVADIVCDGYADEMDINAAVLFFDKKSGEILVANGDYWIDNLVSVTDEETRFYGIYLPKLQREIIIKGKNHNHKVDNNSFNALDNTATIHLSQSCYDAIGSTDKVSLIGSYPAWAFPYNLLGVENVSITLPDNKKNIVCIDGKYMADMYAKGVFIKTDASYTSDTGVNPKCVGIRGVQGGNVGYNYYIKHCKFIGLGTAYHLGGEHLVVEDCIAQRCYYAYAYGNVSFLEQYSNRNTGIHNTTLINCCAEYCKGIFTFGTSMMNTNAISVVDFNIEEGSAGAAWNTDWIYKEESPGAFHGSISYYSINSDTWVVSTRRAWAAGQGKTFKTVNLIAPRTGTTAQRPTNVDYLFEYFDSTINKMIWWNDTAWMDASGTAV
ncbi:MAG: hypothetical protein Q8880_06365 [Bacteroidota bacterium]|nr:hypothetical protein [Bacteroidota bacterium]